MSTAYLEVGNRCYCKCIMCDAHKHKRKEIDDVTFIQRSLKLSKKFDTIRLAGNDPLTHPQFIWKVEFLASMKIKSDVTTCLLTESYKKLQSLSEVDVLRISMLGVHQEYERLHGCNKWSRFEENLRHIMYRSKNPITINYTFNKGINYSARHAGSLVNFLRSFEYVPKVHFFPAIYYGKESWTRVEKEHIYEFLCILDTSVPFEFFGFKLQKRHVCNVQRNNIYVQSNGDCYPCCMAGGEIGQATIKELCLGNIDKDDLEEMMKPGNKPVNNYICDKCTPKYYRQMS